MRPKCLDVLLTLRCVYRCPHCDVWGDPAQSAAMTLAQVRRVLFDAREIPSIETIIFDGGEPFLYYPVLLEGLRVARRLGLRSVVRTNGDWAVDDGSAAAWLAPLAEAGVSELVVSDDDLHRPQARDDRASRIPAAAQQAGIRCSIARTDDDSIEHRGRAAMLPGRSGRAVRRPEELTRCPAVDFANPERLYVDPEGYVHVCPGLTLGSLWWNRLSEVLAAYRPEEDPVLGPLAAGGPYGLACAVDHAAGESYADACQLCYEVRSALRVRYPERLAPPALYGIMPDGRDDADASDSDPG